MRNLGNIITGIIQIVIGILFINIELWFSIAFVVTGLVTIVNELINYE